MSEDIPSSFWDTLDIQKSQNFIFPKISRIKNLRLRENKVRD